MIRPLRQRHRITILVLAVVLPVLFAAGLVSRDAHILAGTLAPELSTRGDGFELVREEQGLWTTLQVTTRLGRRGETWVCELEPRHPLQQPDLLVYWCPGPVTGELTGDSFLLGGLGDGRRRFELPAEFGRLAGHLTLYSLGHGEVVAEAPLQRPGGDR